MTVKAFEHYFVFNNKVIKQHFIFRSMRFLILKRELTFKYIIEMAIVVPVFKCIIIINGSAQCKLKNIELTLNNIEKS